jgi:hypothetical protein
VEVKLHTLGDKVLFPYWKLYPPNYYVDLNPLVSFKVVNGEIVRRGVVIRNYDI